MPCHTIPYRRAKLVRALKSMVDSVSMEATPIGHNELLRVMLLEGSAPSAAFIQERVIPMLSGLEGDVGVHFAGALGYLRRRLVAGGHLQLGLGSGTGTGGSDGSSVTTLLQDISSEWRFRNPDFERSVGALKDINKQGTFFYSSVLPYFAVHGCGYVLFRGRLHECDALTAFDLCCQIPVFIPTGLMLRFWQRSDEAHFTLAQYRDVVSKLLLQLRASQQQRRQTKEAEGQNGNSAGTIVGQVVQTLQKMAQEPVFRPLPHSEYVTDVSFDVCLC